MPSASPSILIADDDPAILATVSRFFKQQGWQLASASSRPSPEGKNLLGVSPQAQALTTQISQLARTDVSVLLTGESGTGKGWIAKIIHVQSSRSAKPFVDVTCSGFSMQYIEGELFGYEKGAFPDAQAQKIGLCEVVNGGTLFLDEVGDLSPALQSRVLEMLHTRRFKRLGGTREIPFDGRIIAATHHTLETAVRDGRLSAELYQAINTASIRVPPLRERSPDDFAYIVNHLLRELRPGAESVMVSPDAIALLSKHDWPGNIRELRLTLERALMRSGGDRVEAYHLPFELRARGTPGKHVRMGDDDLTLDSVVKRHIANVVARFGGNRAEAARALGVTRGTIYNKLRDDSRTP